MRIYNPQNNTVLKKSLIASLTFFRSQRHFDPKIYIQAKSILLNEYMRKYQLKACVVAVSGGIDSATALAMVVHASKTKNSPIKKIIPLLLPLFSKEGATNQKEALDRGKLLTKALGIKPHVVDLTKTHAVMKEAVDAGMGIPGKNWATGQLVSYLRTPAIYYTTSLLDEKNFPSIVIGTTNRDEGAYLGYFGKASDGMVDLQLISDIHKSEVYQTAKMLQVPQEILRVIPSGDTFDGRSDEELFGASYDFVELYLHYLCLTKENKKQLESNWDGDAKKQFTLLGKRLEVLHTYNKHKYLGQSPSVHLDVYDRAVPNGWTEKIFSPEEKAPPKGIFNGEFSLQEAFIDTLFSKSHQTRKKTLFSIGQQTSILQNVFTKVACQKLCDVLKEKSWVAVGQDGMKRHFDPLKDTVGSYRATLYSPYFAALLWQRMTKAIPDIRIMDNFSPTDWDGTKVWRAVGISPVMRFIRYKEGGLLVPHYDAPYIYNKKKRTLMSIVIYLTGAQAYVGGATRYIKDKQVSLPMNKRDFSDWTRFAKKNEVLYRVVPEAGSALIFDHRLLHDSEPIKPGGNKIILRTDILFERCGMYE